MNATTDEKSSVLDPSLGASQVGNRAHNERLVLSLIRRHGSLSKAEIARRSQLSAQAISVIMRALEADDLILRGAPSKGRVGQPSIPMLLNPDGVFSFGLKIGRRSAEIVLMDFVGEVRRKISFQYSYPLPVPIVGFVSEAISTLYSEMTSRQKTRIAGIGIAAPYELWNWLDEVGAPKQEMEAWRGFDLASEIERVSSLTVTVENDATSACSAEHILGRGREFADYAYFFVGYFVGGGVVLNHSVYSGRRGNAGAFGSMPLNENRQLIDCASIFLLESVLDDNREVSLGDLEVWEGFEAELEAWLGETARNLAKAAVSICSVIDFEAILIEGSFPVDVRNRLVKAMQAEFSSLDLRGIEHPKIVAGTIGRDARILGAASLPLFTRYLVDQRSLVGAET